VTSISALDYDGKTGTTVYTTHTVSQKCTKFETV